MMNRMIVANLVHRPFRTLISVVAVAVEVTLILLIVGIMLGILNDSSSRQVGIGADIMVQPPGSSLIMGVTGAPVSVKVAGKIGGLAHVTAVAPVVMQVTTAGTVEVLYGIDLQSFDAVSGGFHYLSGGPFQGPYDMIIDDLKAASKHLKVGDTLETLNHPFRICGIVEHGKGAREFVPVATLQDLAGAPGKASIFYVKLDDPNNAEAVVKEIKSIPGMQEYGVHSLKEYLSLMTSASIPGLNTVIDVVIGIAMVIGFIVIFQAMYAAVMERTREIGILKSLGASKLYIVNAVLRETLLIATGGVILGIVFSYGARAGLKARFQTLPVLITYAWLVKAAIIALVGSLLGASYPAIKAAQKDPIDALAYE
ncbi:MAG: FtsX-like permease family protein [Candidatus Korobacteraceae bacterium]|jgi:putative ABC transport system permease protein